MVKNKNNFVEYVVQDLLRGVSGIKARAMFGGHGVYKDSQIFAIIVHDELYFKVGESNLEDYKKYNSQPFVYISPQGRSMTMSYYKLPLEIMDDKIQIKKWVEKSLQVRK